MSSEKTIVIPDLVFLGEDTDKGGRLYAYVCAMGKGKAKSEADGAESTAFIPELEKTKLAVGENV